MRKPHLYRLGDALVADDATVVGEVSLGQDVSVWYGTVIRGDVASISVGRRTNIQDQSVVHAFTGIPVIIGDDNIIGHSAVIHCTSLGNRCLVGIGAKILSGAKIGDDCIIAAGALILEDAEIPDGSVVMGAPGKVVRRTTEKERELFAYQVKKYIRLAESHLEGAPPFDWRSEPIGWQ